MTEESRFAEMYLDVAASAPIRPEVLAAMWPYLTVHVGNPASTHDRGRELAQTIAHARTQIGRSLGARANEVIVTAGGTESDNAAIKGIALARPRGRHIVTAATEHEAVLASCDYLARLHGFAVSFVPTDRHGVVTPEALREVVRADTTLVTIAHANNEIGTVQDIAALAKVAHEVGARIHTDAVQSAPWLPVDLRELGVDALSISGHKVGAPTGVGALLLRNGVPFEPLMHGGGHQQGRRSGTEDTAGTVALATALALNAADREQRSAAAASARDALIDIVLRRVPGALLTGSRTARLPGHASFCIASTTLPDGRTAPAPNGETVLIELEQRGVIASAGSACAAGSSDVSHVLRAIGLGDDLARTSLRFSFGAEITRESAAGVGEAIAETVALVREAHQK
ncbi:cysteine desulfurase family protein [Curtobacterium ammoniigenes]|uniref:cysteine desulfurase family protein n=1 Tax=Curtobacterium ammoniigenes TaxID=395387 RepID=UPI000B28DFAC|nr:cysteine desulfurase family protein [Curtobacterium ammoniigenes]